jgi:hypothetical protein
MLKGLNGPRVLGILTSPSVSSEYPYLNIADGEQEHVEFMMGAGERIITRESGIFCILHEPLFLVAAMGSTRQEKSSVSPPHEPHTHGL